MNNIDSSKFLENILESYAPNRGLDKDSFSMASTTGLVIDSMMDGLENIIAEFQARDPEKFLVTARNRSSLLKYARSNRMDINLATPARMSMLVEIDIDECKEFAEYDQSAKTWKYTISKDSEINVGDKYFSFDYDINITIFEIDGGTTIRVQYNMEDGYKNPYVVVDNPNIKNVYSVNENKLYMFLYVSQVKRAYKEISYVNKFISRTFSVKYNDNLVSIRVQHKENGGEYNDIDTAMFLSDVEGTNKSIFYYLDDYGGVVFDNKYKSGNFIPEDGSTFMISLYETLGEDGNFEYTGGSIPIKNANEDELYIKCQPLSDSSGGQNELSDKEMKRSIIDFNSTRKSLITENDIAVELKDLGSTYKVVKLRDDIAHRIYGIYSTIKHDGLYLPTNTLDISINGDLCITEADHVLDSDPVKIIRENVGDTSVGDSIIVEMNKMGNILFTEEPEYYIGAELKLENSVIYSIEECSRKVNGMDNIYMCLLRIVDSSGIMATNVTEMSNLFISKKIGLIGRMITTDEHQVNCPDRNNVNYLKNFDPSLLGINYTCPYTLIFGIQNDINVFRAFESIFKKSFDTDYIYINPKNQLSYMINKVTFTKMRVDEIDYSKNEKMNIEISFEFRVNSTDKKDSEHVPEEISIYMEPTNGAGSTNKFIKFDSSNMEYFEEEDYFLVKKNISYSLNSMSLDGEVDISLLSENLIDEIDYKINMCDIGFNIYVIKDGGEIDEDKPSDLILPNNSEIVDKLANLFSIDSFELISDLTYILNLQYHVDEMLVDNVSLTIKNVPLIEREYFYNNQEDVIGLLEKEKAKIDSIFNNVKDDFDVSVLFTRTSGFSELFKKGIDLIEDLDRVDLDMTFNVVFKYMNYVEIDKIIEYIRDYILDIDFYIGENFHFSRMIGDIKTEFPEIDILELEKINSEVATSPMLSYRLDKVDGFQVPEVLNFKRDQLGNVAIKINKK